MDRYKIRSPSLGAIGLALIINIRKGREGSKEDVKNMKKLFQYLNFDVEEDLTKNGIVKAIIDFCEKLENNLADMVHGDEDQVRGSDDRPANIRKEILDRFSNENCPIMIEKPKFFVFQSCRGTEKDYGMRGMSVPGASAAMDGSARIASVLEDAIIAYATIPDYVAWRSTTDGSHFLNTMFEVFMQHAHDTEIQDLFKLVSQKMKKVQIDCEKKINDEKILVECRATSEVTYRGFTKDLYFQPRIDQTSDT